MQIGGVALLICAPNDTGKTHLLHEIATRSPVKGRILTVHSADMGGLRDMQSKGVFDSIDTVIITDMQSIISRKQEVMYSTLSQIQDMIDGVSHNGADYQSVKMKSRKEILEPKDSRKINFIIACTPAHIARLSYPTYNDFLTRFALIYMKREKGYYTETFDWESLKKLEPIDNGMSKSRKELHLNNLSEICMHYNLKIPFYQWNPTVQQWKRWSAQFPLPKIRKGNNDLSKFGDILQK